MDQVKIGKFIAGRRKSVNLTQAQLAEKLGITDRAVSKWETGKTMPDTALMLELCDILKISVNELLMGEKIAMENIDRKNEKLLLALSGELAEKNKMLWKTMWVILSVSMIALLAGCLLVKLWVPEGIWQGVAVLGICALCLPPCFYALKLEVSIGAYKCRRCGTRIVPTYMQALNAPHMGATRYLKCPGCGRRSWCKKDIEDETA